jgi:hypothetical protein
MKSFAATFYKYLPSDFPGKEFCVLLAIVRDYGAIEQ